MIIRVNSGNSGIKEYLEHGQKKDRYFSRDELDHRLVLNGDLDVVNDEIKAIDNLDVERDKYFHITLAFKEDAISEKMLSDISNEFREFYFKAYGDNEINYYAEAHLPKIKSYVDAHTGEYIARKPHIHIIVPIINTVTYNTLNLNVSATINYIDAFQEYINDKYGLASPKDNIRYKVNDNSEFISRYKGDGFKGKHHDIRERIFDEIISQNIYSFSELQKHLNNDGYATKIRNEGKGSEHEYINIIDKDGVSINLRDKVFRAEFLAFTNDKKILTLKSDIAYIEPSKSMSQNKLIGESNGTGKTTSEYREYESTGIKPANLSTVDQNIGSAHDTLKNIRNNLERNSLDQGSIIGGSRRRRVAISYARVIARSQADIGRDTSEYESDQYSDKQPGESSEITSDSLDEKYVKLLQEWDDYKAYEYKFVSAIASKQERDRFNKLPAMDKKSYIQQKQIEFNTKYGVDNGISINDGEYRDYGSVGVKQTDFSTVNQNIRTADDALESIGDNLGRSVTNKASVIGRERRWQISARYARIIGRGEDGIRQNINQHESDKLGVRSSNKETRNHNPIDNEYDRLLTKLQLNRVEYKELISKYNTEIHADVMLELLEKTHGVNPELYRITKASDGSDRIGCGSRNLNMADFCLKEMNFSLEEANNILANAYGMQLNVNRERGWSRDSAVYLSDKYKVWFTSYKSQRADSILKHKDNFKLKREEIVKKYNEKIVNTRAGDLPYHAKREQISLFKIDKLLELEALNKSKYADNVSLKNKYNLEMQKAYRVFLCDLAQNNDDKALLELRRLRIDYKDLNNSDSFNYVDRYQDYKLNLTHSIDLNGVINYQHNGKTILQDHGKRIAIIRHSDENIKLTLDLAMQKFGMNIGLTGSDKFRQRAVDMAIKNNYKINFIDEFSQQYYEQKIAEYQKNSKRLEVSKLELIKDKPNLLYIGNIGDIVVVNSNKRSSIMSAVQLIDPATNKMYEVSGYKINFIAKNLVAGQFVEVVSDSTGGISLKSSNLEKEIRKLKADTLDQVKTDFISQVKSDYGVKELKHEYSGKLINTGMIKGDFYALVAVGGEVKRIVSNDLKLKLDELKIAIGDVVSIAVPTTKNVEVNKTENIVSIKRADKIFDDLLLEVDLQKGRIDYKKEYFGRIMEVKPVQLKSGSKTNLVVINDILSGREQTMYADEVSDLNPNDFAHLGQKSFNNFEITKLNDRLQAKREQILGEQNTRGVAIGEIAKIGLKIIKGNEVYYVELRTDEGIVIKYGNKVRQEIDQLALKVGEGITITNSEKLVPVSKEENVLKVKQLDKGIEALVDKKVELILNKIEQEQKIRQAAHRDFEM